MMDGGTEEETEGLRLESLGREELEPPASSLSHPS